MSQMVDQKRRRSEVESPLTFDYQMIFDDVLTTSLTGLFLKLQDQMKFTTILEQVAECDREATDLLGGPEWFLIKCFCQ